jgi:superfamily II DNA or RNA helicase
MTLVEPKAAVLEPGRVASLRQRLWRVDRVDGAVFAATPLDGREATSQRFHQALEAVTSGKTPYPEATSYGSPLEQDLLLTAQRFALVHGTAPLLGLQRSRAIPTDYQLVPLLMTLGSDRVRLLIADAVGTGKSVEAGLVVAELIARGMARRILVCVPAPLRDQWRDALEHFFHLNATVVAGHLLPALERRLLPGQSVWSAHDIVVASVDYLKTRPETVLSHGWDVILIDEAHLCAKPHTFPGAAEPDMARWAFATEAARRARHLLLLTATPHNGYSDSFASLFEMLDPALVDHSASGPIVRRDRAAPHVVQRRRADIEAWYTERGQQSPFPTRDSDEQIIDLQTAPDMRHLLQELSGYTEALFGAAHASPMNGWVAAHFQRRALSSPHALRQSVRSRLKSVQVRAAAEADRRTLSEARAFVADLFDSADASDEQQASRLDRAATTLAVAEETTYLTRLLSQAEAVTPAKDPKLEEAFGLLPRRMAAHPTMQRVIVFTKYKDTLDYLVKQFETVARKPTKRRQLPAGTEVFSIDGDLSLAERRAVLAAFERAERAVLVATDCISEGLNLQYACAEVVHWELPWNPNRLEQRNGRVDRFHQREPFVGIRTLIYDDILDVTLLELIVRKSEQMLADYGFVPPFLANPDILSYLAASAASTRRVAPTLFDALADAPSVLNRAVGDADVLDVERVNRIRDESFYGHEQVSLGSVAGAMARSQTELGNPELLERFLRSSLATLPGISTKDVPGGVTVVGSHPDVTDVLPRADQVLTFDPETGFADPELDIVDLAHPLLRRLVDIVLDHSRQPGCAGRVAARNADVEEVTAAVWTLVRYAARSDPPVLLEELSPFGMPVWGDNVVPGTDELRHLLADAGDDARKGADDIEEAAGALLGRRDLPERIEAHAAARAALLAERHAGLDAPWADGLERVEVMSVDVVGFTLLCPQPPLMTNRSGSRR